jgi:hypothetical protein
MHEHGSIIEHRCDARKTITMDGQQGGKDAIQVLG